MLMTLPWTEKRERAENKHFQGYPHGATRVMPGRGLPILRIPDPNDSDARIRRKSGLAESAFFFYPASPPT
jgi:hypothetical protein